jgi:hypothetical protein
MAQIKDMTILDLGLRDYEEVWRLQKEFVARRRAGEIPDTVILVEHPPVFYHRPPGFAWPDFVWTVRLRRRSRRR